MRIYLIITMMIICLCGCIVKPQTRIQEIKTNVDTGRPAFAVQEPIRGVLDLYEAIARSIKYNFKDKADMMANVLNSSQLNVPSYQTMPKLLHSAGYGPKFAYQNQFSSEGVSISGGNQVQAYDIAQMWNTLDFAINYAAYQKFPGDLPKLIQKNIIHNIINEVRYAYYRAASAQSLLGETNTLLKQAKTVLRQTREKYSQQEKIPRKTLENQRELIKNISILWELTQKMTPAKSELAVLMNLSPGADFQILEPAWNQPEILPVKKSIKGMDIEYLALKKRMIFNYPEFQKNTGVYETRKALLNIQPGVDFDSGYDADNNTFVYSKDWWDAGLRVSKIVFDLFSYNQYTSQYSKGQALNMAVITQLHLARQGYAFARENYNLSNLLGDVNNKLDIGRYRKNELSDLNTKINMLLARMRQHSAYIELESAADRLYNSIGFDLFQSNMSSASISGLADFFKMSLARRGEKLRLAQTDYYPHDSNISDPVTGSKNYLAGADSFELKQPLDTVSRVETPQALTKKDIVVVSAASAEQKGQKHVRKVSVYRDVVNIHFGPSLKSAIKGQGLIGEEYNLLGWSPKGWLKIEMSDGSSGWIPTKYVRPVDELITDKKPYIKSDKKKKTSVKKVKSKSKFSKKLIMTTTRANVRSGPGLTYKINYIAAKGVRYNVQSVSGQWFKIKAKSGVTGWLHESVVKVLADSN